MALPNGGLSRPDHEHDETFTVAIYDAEEGGYWAEVLELPGCASQGENLDELRANIIDAIGAVLEVYAEDGERPRPREHLTRSGVRVVTYSWSP